MKKNSKTKIDWRDKLLERVSLIFTIPVAYVLYLLFGERN